MRLNAIANDNSGIGWGVSRSLVHRDYALVVHRPHHQVEHDHVEYWNTTNGGRMDRRKIHRIRLLVSYVLMEGSAYRMYFPAIAVPR